MNRDGSGDVKMTYYCFKQSLFELADVWADEVSEASYVAFLSTVFHGIAEVKDSAICAATEATKAASLSPATPADKRLWSLLRTEYAVMTLDKVDTIVTEDGDFREDIKEKIEAAKVQTLQTLQKSLSGDSNEPTSSVDSTDSVLQLFAAMQRVSEEDTGQSRQDSLNGESSPASVVQPTPADPDMALADTEPMPADTNHLQPTHTNTTLRPHPPAHRSPPSLRSPRRFIPATAEEPGAQDHIQRALNLPVSAISGRRKKQILPSVKSPGQDLFCSNDGDIVLSTPAVVRGPNVVSCRPFHGDGMTRPSRVHGAATARAPRQRVHPSVPGAGRLCWLHGWRQSAMQIIYNADAAAARKAQLPPISSEWSDIFRMNEVQTRTRAAAALERLTGFPGPEFCRRVRYV
jgi:hypothetical protein